jgi:Tfp pilus assembly pilus retraction ATPase PilT
MNSLQIEQASQVFFSPGARLRAIAFTDVFFSEAGEAYLRGVPDSDGALSPVPEDAVDDLMYLHRLVCERGSREDEFSIDFGEMRFRVSKTATVSGIWYALRRAFSRVPRLGELKGIPLPVLKQLVNLGKDGSNGLILVCGGTGHGKTTTTSALLQEYLIQYGNVAVTIEDPVELPLNGPIGPYGHCFQTDVSGGDFALAMKRTMRRAPRYIMLGEVRGPQEASEVIRASNNGHLVLSTIHAGSCIEGINSLLKLIAGTQPLDLARSMLADGLAAVLHQSLVPRKSAQGRSSFQIEMSYLFIARGEHGKGTKTLIRSGKTEQLSSELHRQQSLVQREQPPVQ